MWLCTLPSVAKSLGRFLGLRRGCRSRGGVEAFPYLRFPLESTLPQGAMSRQPVATSRLHTLPQPSSHGQTPPRPLPAVGPRASVSRPSLPWSFPLAGEALSKPSCCLKLFLPPLPRCQASLAIERLPCSCLLLQRHQSVTPQGVPCPLTVSLCFPENPTSNEVTRFHLCSLHQVEPLCSVAASALPCGNTVDGRECFFLLKSIILSQ